jgi:hypothetical protein
MAALNKPGATLLPKDKHSEIATFKNSLRLWQAQWKAQKAAQESASKEASKGLARTDISV